MELKVKYQYTYFIKPFLIKENKYEKYLFSLLSNKNYKLKIFEKERDLNLYSYFIQNAREYFFPTFAFSKGNIRNLEEMDIKTKTKILSKFYKVISINGYDFYCKKENLLFFTMSVYHIIYLGNFRYEFK